MVAVSASAQVGEYRTDLAIGFSGGYSLSSVSFVPKVPQDQLGGLTGGFTARYTCEKYFKSICALVAEVNYSQIGWKERIWDMNDEPVVMHNDPSQTLRYSRKMTYLQIPVLARLGWGRERSGMQFFFQVGPQLGLYMSDKVDSNLMFMILLSTQRPRMAFIVLITNMATVVPHILWLRTRWP